jgi:hypothetical protein
MLAVTKLAVFPFCIRLPSFFADNTGLLLTDTDNQDFG